ncbi:MAG TPA: cell division ATP-binding protein FtsE [Patescibacteria group bacterium]|nr:cell division ATP-binding protein FtsE [Patescibacteria group bacterium]
MIVFKKVNKQFPDGTMALEALSFQIDDGEFVFIIGPSGAGKTTIMKLLRRQFLPSSGTVVVGDKNITELTKEEIPHLRREVTMCFQDFKLLSDRTVGENVGLSLEITDLPAAEIETKVADSLAKVGLKGKENFFPMQLSGGELQRVGIARAIVGKPKIILADEPTGNLDPDSGFDILKVFKEINLSGTTVIVATHNAELVDRLKERVIALDRGKIVSDEKKGKYHLKK